MGQECDKGSPGWLGFEPHGESRGERDWRAGPFPRWLWHPHLGGLGVPGHVSLLHRLPGCRASHGVVASG